MITRLTRDGRTVRKFFAQTILVILLVCTLGAVSLSARGVVTRWWNQPRPVPPMMAASPNPQTATPPSIQNYAPVNASPAIQQGYATQTRTVWIWPRPSSGNQPAGRDRDSDRKEERAALEKRREREFNEKRAQEVQREKDAKQQVNNQNNPKASREPQRASAKDPPPPATDSKTSKPPTKNSGDKNQKKKP